MSSVPRRSLAQIEFFAYPENKITFLSIGAPLVVALNVLSPLVLVLQLGLVWELDLSAAGFTDGVEG